jgi:wyosine [tRNA(Phe)-imidazoG37] synthetase (radical SAM superfamily)
MKYVFGPVNSRRFGMSLGIDLSPDSKSCNFDCVYCELKGAKPVSNISNPPKVSNIIEDVEQSLKIHTDIDVITITSNGEPTLYDDLDLLVDELNRIKQNRKILILSNGSTICDLSIRKTLKKIDIVKLSLDCVTQKCFKKIDRPLKGIEIDDLIKCMTTFSKEFDKDLIIEVLAVKGINDNEDEFNKLNKVLNEIKPKRVDIGTIDRPPAYKVKPVGGEHLSKLSKVITNIPVSLIYKNVPKNKEDFTQEEILGLLSRRPQSQFDIDNFFNDKSKNIIEDLLKSKIIEKRDIAGVKFYTLKER